MVGLVLGLLGSGGSILAVPLLLYLARIKDPHVAIDTSAVAVSLSALINLVLHARKGTIRWPCALTFAFSGSLGALMGAAFGKVVNGQKLLLAFAAAMFGVGLSMLLRKLDAGNTDARITPGIAVRLIPTGFFVGMASGFFGIGGLAGGLLSQRASTKLADRKGALMRLFAVFIFVTATYTSWKALADISG